MMNKHDKAVIEAAEKYEDAPGGDDYCVSSQEMDALEDMSEAVHARREAGEQGDECPKCGANQEGVDPFCRGCNDTFGPKEYKPQPSPAEAVVREMLETLHKYRDETRHKLAAGCTGEMLQRLDERWLVANTLITRCEHIARKHGLEVG
jgi:hypothetical protein